MPFALHQSLSTKAELWVWKIKESEEELREGLHFHSRLEQRLAKLKAGSQRKGVLAVQQLLLKAGIDPITMQHDITARLERFMHPRANIARQSPHRNIIAHQQAIKADVVANNFFNKRFGKRAGLAGVNRVEAQMPRHRH